MRHERVTHHTQRGTVGGRTTAPGKPATHSHPTVSLVGLLVEATHESTSPPGPSTFWAPDSNHFSH